MAWTSHLLDNSSNLVPKAIMHIVYNKQHSKPYTAIVNGIVESDATEDVAEALKNILFDRNRTPTPKRWTSREDEILRDAVEREGCDWERISRIYFQGLRSHAQFRRRWTKTLQPALIGPWTSEEDKVIKESVKKGLRWVDVARLLPGRMTEHVKRRWENSPDPTLNRQAWTDEELQTLFQRQTQMGNQWTKIAELLPGRTCTQVKNRWYNGQAEKRRKKRRVK